MSPKFTLGYSSFLQYTKKYKITFYKITIVFFLNIFLSELYCVLETYSIVLVYLGINSIYFCDQIYQHSFLATSFSATLLGLVKSVGTFLAHPHLFRLPLFLHYLNLLLQLNLMYQHLLLLLNMILFHNEIDLI